MYSYNLSESEDEEDADDVPTDSFLKHRCDTMAMPGMR